MAAAWNERKQRRQLWIWNQNHIRNLLEFGCSMIEEVGLGGSRLWEREDEETFLGKVDVDWWKLARQ